MIKSIIQLLTSALSIWEHENAKKYLEEKLDLETRYDQESDKVNPDRNVLDRIERDILRLSELVSFEIQKSGKK